MRKRGNSMSTLKRTALFLGLVSAFGIVGASGEEALEISTNTGELYVVSTLAGPAKMKLVVTGPNGFRDEQNVEGEGIFWSAPAGAADGIYRFDVYSTPVDELIGNDGLTGMGELLDGGAVPTDSYSSGSFEIDNGMIVDPQGEDDLSSVLLKGFNRVVGTIASLGVNDANAQNLTASSGIPTLNFFDTDAPGFDTGTS